MHVPHSGKTDRRLGRAILGATCGVVLGLAPLSLAQPVPPQPRPTNPRPQPQLSPLQAAHKAVNDAKKDLDDNSADLKQIHQKLQDELESHDDFKDAAAALHKADLAYTDACKPVLDKIAADPKYVEAKKKHEEALAKYHDLQDSDSADTAELSQLSRDAADADGVMNKMQFEALMTDPGVAAARKVRDAKRRALEKLKSENEEQIKQNPDYLDAQKQIQPYIDRLKQAQDALSSLIKSQSHTNNPPPPQFTPPPMRNGG